MKEQILKLRQEGKTYNEISEIVGCSKSTISYHCGEGQKEKANKRNKKYKKNNSLKIKIDNFKSRGLDLKITDFQRNRLNGKHIKGRDYNFGLKDLLKKLGNTFKCYLSGREIDINEPKTYSLDHIVPVSKGGDNSLENLGLTTKEVNMSKSDMSVEDFVQLCKEVCENNGYKVIREMTEW